MFAPFPSIAGNLLDAIETRLRLLMAHAAYDEIHPGLLAMPDRSDRAELRAGRLSVRACSATCDFQAG